MLLNALTIAEKLSTGGITALVGILMTFVMLVILIGCIILMNYIIKKSKVWSKKLKKNKVESIPSSNISNISNDTNETEGKVETEDEIDEKTLKAINSAIDMYMSQGENGVKHTNYTIKRIKKI